MLVGSAHVGLPPSRTAVARAMDKQIAGMQANGVPGAFGVTNNLAVEEEEKEKKK